VVSTALNSGVPLALSGDSEIATQFDKFTRRILNPEGGPKAVAAPVSRNLLGLGRIASLW
jgi:hypothetical protein